VLRATRLAPTFKREWIGMPARFVAEVSHVGCAGDGVLSAGPR